MGRLTAQRKRRGRGTCEVCSHDHGGTNGRCQCGCYGYWPAEAKFCANRQCKGLNCRELRAALKGAKT